MKYLVLLFVLFSLGFLNIGGCGSGGDSDNLASCDFDITALLNGPNANNAETFWSCSSPEAGQFDVVVFGDGTGESTDIGVFTWQQTGCRSITLQSASGNVDIVNIDVINNTLSFMQESNVPELDDIGANCQLNSF